MKSGKQIYTYTVGRIFRCLILERKANIALVLLCFTFYCAAQKNQSVLNEKEFLEFKQKIVFQDSIFQHQIESLSFENGNLRALLNDTVNHHFVYERLHQAIMDASTTINNQSAWIDIYTQALNWVLIIIALLTLIFGVVAIREAGRANKATDRLNDRIDYFDDNINRKLDERFNDQRSEAERSRIEELFKDLVSNLSLQRKMAFEKISGIESHRLVRSLPRIFRILNSDSVTREEKAILVEVLIQIDRDEGN